MRITGLSDRSDREGDLGGGHECLADFEADCDEQRGRGGFSMPWNGSRTSRRVPFWKVKPLVYVYTCRDLAEISARSDKNVNVGASSQMQEDATSDRNVDNPIEDEDFFGDANDTREGESQEDQPPSLYSVTRLPALQIENVWESLVLDPNVKQYLLNYISSGCLFSSRGVDKNLVTWNRVALLHGPPGSGKTSLSRALSHKLSIRLECSEATLIEIHANNLFRYVTLGDTARYLFAQMPSPIIDLLFTPCGGALWDAQPVVLD